MVNNPNNIIKMNNPLSPQIVNNHIDHERIGISNIYSLFIFPILQQRGKR
jgi:hypothetical protein